MRRLGNSNGYEFDNVARIRPDTPTCPKKLNLLVLKKFFETNEIVGVTKVERLKLHGDTKITFAEKGMPVQLVEIPDINGIPFKMIAYKWDNLKLGVISHAEIANVDQAELSELLKGQLQVVKKLSDTTALIGHHTTLPKEAQLAWVTVPVKPYCRPKRCYKCQHYGHTVNKCEAQEDTCSLCGSPGHRYTVCPNTVKKCAACGGPHSSADRTCPKWKEECRIAKARLDKKLSYKEALLAVRSQDKKKPAEKKNQEKKTQEKKTQEKTPATQNQEHHEARGAEAHVVNLTVSDFFHTYEDIRHEEDEQQDPNTNEWTLQESKKRRRVRRKSTSS